jgi:hypothetical protein
MNRRGMLRASASGLSLILSCRVQARDVTLNAVFAEKAVAVASGSVLPTAIVYDERYDEARAFAARVGPHVVALYPTRGDATDFWYGALRILLRQQGGAVAGLTTYSDLVIARSCGRESGLRLVFERNYRGGVDMVAPTGGGFDLLVGATVSLGSNKPARASELTAWLLQPRRDPSAGV